MTRNSAAMRLWIVITVAAVAMTACTPIEGAGSDTPAESGSQGNVALFCRVWPDAREKLLGMVTGELSIEYQDADIALARFLADVDSTVPAKVHAEWNRAYATYQQVSDLLFLTGYSEGMIRDVHLKMAFGDAGPEAAVADTEVAVAVIDDWAITACGDFASRWPELERILGIDIQPNWDALSRDIDRFESMLAIGDRLVPDEIAQYWATAATYQRGYFEFARTIDFDPENIPEDAEGEALFIEFVGVPPGEARDTVDGAREKISLWVEANPGTATVISGPSGGPRSLTIRILPNRYLTNRRLFLALLPPGTDFAMLRSASDYVAATCTEVEESGGRWSEEQKRLVEQERVTEQERLEEEKADKALEDQERLEEEEARKALEERIELGGEEARQALEEEEVRIAQKEEERIRRQEQQEREKEEEARQALEEEEERLRREQEWEEQFSRPLLPIASEGEYFQASVCWLISQEAEPALVPGGTYELFVGAYIGEPGNYGLYFAAPEYCLQFPVTVDGDTVVDLPELEPCELDPIGRPEEIARRTPPPGEAGGTLRVRVDSALQPGGFDFCGLSGVLLPAGTTLNDIGRGDAWPSGAFSFGRPNPRDIEQADEQRWARMPGQVPILSMPPSGTSLIGFGPDIRPDGPWDTRFPDPVALPTGSYDLRIENICEDEDAQNDDDVRHRCGFVAVEVDGATIVEMPELGVCP